MSDGERGASFGPDAERALADVLDELVPPRPDGRLPGAGALGIGGHVVAVVRQRPELAPVLAQGLAELHALVRSRGVAGLGELAPPERLAALAELGARAPAFLPTLGFLAYAGYYQDPRVLEVLGHEPRPPFPKGYAVPPTDFAILEPVRRRAPIYREP